MVPILRRLLAIWPKWLPVTCSEPEIRVSPTETRQATLRSANRMVVLNLLSALPWRQAIMEAWEAAQSEETYLSHLLALARTTRRWSSFRGSLLRPRLRTSDCNMSAILWCRTTAARLRPRRTPFVAWTRDWTTRVTWQEPIPTMMAWCAVRTRHLPERTRWWETVSPSFK